jgi:hypothetical protein
MVSGWAFGEEVPLGARDYADRAVMTGRRSQPAVALLDTAAARRDEASREPLVVRGHEAHAGVVKETQLCHSPYA